MFFMGGDALDIADDGYHSARRMMCCFLCLAICLVVIGPILMIVGIAMLVGENTREADVSNYNNAVKTWESSAEYSQIATWSGGYVANNGRSGNFGIQNPAVVVSGNRDGVDSATSRYAQAIVPNYGATSYTITLTNGPTMTVPVTPVKTSTVSVDCERDRTASGSSRTCTTSSMRSYCQNTYGSSATFSGPSSCDRGDSCGSCSYASYVREVCVVVARSSTGTWARDMTKTSCEYPFRDFKYSSSGSTVTLRVMSNLDPFIKLEEITDGSADFGLTEAQQRTTGLVLIIIGGCITAALVIPIVLYCRSRNQVQTYHTQHAQGQYPQAEMQQQGAVTGQPVQGDPGYNNNNTGSPGYDNQQQQQGYGQPPPQQQQPGGYDSSNQQQPNQGHYPQQQQQPGYYGQQQQPGYPQQQPGYPQQQLYPQQQPGYPQQQQPGYPQQQQPGYGQQQQYPPQQQQNQEYTPQYQR